MTDHRKHDKKAEPVRKAISDRLAKLLTPQNKIPDELLIRCKELGFSSLSNAYQSICSFRRGAKASGFGDAREFSFNSPDLTNLSIVLYALNVPESDDVVRKVREYDSRFIYPPKTANNPSEILFYDI